MILYSQTLMKNLLIILAILVISLSIQQCPNNDKEFLVTFHPHLDAFWLNYDNQLKDINFIPAGFLYAMNQRNSKTIFNSMLQALIENASRKYFVTQAVFFKDWYDYLSSQDKQKVHNVLNNGQLQIGNGGWVQNDEAVCYFDDILDQYTYGHEFLKREFQYQVKIGWATDSFGHSHSQAALLHLLGIEFQGIERVDDRYVNEHNHEALLEFYWIPVSDSNNLTYGGVLNQVRHFLHEVNNLRNSRTKDIERDFEQIQQQMSNVYHKNKYFRFLGNDFQEFISKQFTVLQQSFDQMNLQKGNSDNCPAYKYGNPLDYLKIISEHYKSHQLPTRKYDFIPNWDQDRYWSGYFTTDPLLKKYCKDFSRLVNLYRKIILSQQVSLKSSSNNDTLKSAQQLLAVMQHHDGITATSKTYIEDQFMKRMDKRNSMIIQQIKNIYKIPNNVYSICELYKNQNKCQFHREWIKGPTEPFKLSIITLGNPKVQTIQITKIPKGTYLTVEGIDYEIFCNSEDCSLIFQATLIPGINQYRLILKNQNQISDKIVTAQKVGNLNYEGRDCSVKIEQFNQEIIYTYGNNRFMKFGFYISENKGGSRHSMAWDKYGRRQNKTEHINPGMYIMFNSGQLSKLNHKYEEINVYQGRNYRKIVCRSNIINFQMFIKVNQPYIIDTSFSFTPPTSAAVDYFLKVSSEIQSSTLYHDSNGYLVISRPINWRPDYNYQIKEEDAINANTYPVTTFAYFLSDSQKFVFFSDRAQGVCSYNKSLLINFDRLAFDDGKGVGQSYMQKKKNNFHYRFGSYSRSEDIQRLWQRKYDDANIGVISNQLNSRVQKHSAPQQYHESRTKYMKYTIFHLNENQIVLRLINFAEFQQNTLPKYKQNQEGGQFVLDIFGVNLKFVDIVESYANGIPKQKNWRKYWSPITDQINNRNAGFADTDSLLTFRPLQIRSFRINFKQKITMPNSQATPPINPKSLIVQHKNMRKRCF